MNKDNPKAGESKEHIASTLTGEYIQTGSKLTNKQGLELRILKRKAESPNLKDKPKEYIMAFKPEKVYISSLWKVDENKYYLDFKGKNLEMVKEGFQVFINLRAS